MRQLMAVLPLLAAVAAASAQAPSPPQSAEAPAPVFEVASVKPYKETTNGRLFMNFTPGRFTATGVPLRFLILNAYRVSTYQLVGGPGWLDSERFDVAAKAPDGARPDQMQLMLRALLADRFKLVVHNETRDAPVYVLVMARGDGKLGPKMTRSTVDCAPIVAERQAAARARGPGAAAAPPFIPPKPGERPVCTSRMSGTSGPGGGFVLTYSGGSQTIASLAQNLSGNLNRRVIDRTGLTGEFDFDLQYAPERPLSTAAAGAGGGTTVAPVDDSPSIFSAVQELGLKLESQRGPVEFLVIDSAEQPMPD
jgi:uncharacterized protein (TIGR03435 family)